MQPCAGVAQSSAKAHKVLQPVSTLPSTRGQWLGLGAGLGASSLEDYLVSSWETNFARRDPADLLAQFWTWQHGDISANALYGGDLPRALAAIEAKVLLMPGDHDLYFQVDDNRLELPHLRDGELHPIPSVWGHRAGNPVSQPEDRAFIEGHVRALLAR